MRKELYTGNVNNSNLMCPECGAFLGNGKQFVKVTFKCNNCGASILATRTENGSTQLSVWSYNLCVQKEKNKHERCLD